MADYDRINFTLTGFVCTALIWNAFHVDLNVYVLVSAFYRPTTMRSNAITRTILIRLHNSKSMRLFDIPNLDIFQTDLSVDICNATLWKMNLCIHVYLNKSMYSIKNGLHVNRIISILSLRYLRFTVDFITFGFFAFIESIHPNK